MAGRHEAFAHVVKTSQRIVRRKSGGGIKVDHPQVKQVPNGVPVFRAVQPPQDALAGILTGRLSRTRQGLRQVRHHPLHLGRRGLLLPFWRHLGKVELVENLLKTLRLRQFGKVAHQHVKTPVALLLLRAMALHAIGL